MTTEENNQLLFQDNSPVHFGQVAVAETVIYWFKLLP